MVRIGDADKIAFVRTKQVEGRPNNFYVHEVFTEDEITKPEDKGNADTDADRRIPNASDFSAKKLPGGREVKAEDGVSASTRGGPLSATGF